LGLSETPLARSSSAHLFFALNIVLPIAGEAKAEFFLDFFTSVIYIHSRENSA